MIQFLQQREIFIRIGGLGCPLLLWLKGTIAYHLGDEIAAIRAIAARPLVKRALGGENIQILRLQLFTGPGIAPLPLLCKNKVLFNFLSAFAVGAAICLTCRGLPALHSDKVMIGVIMLLVPGVAFTNAVKDIFIGDTISGVMRMIEAVLWAAALALGFALAGSLVGG